jgi:hypothetical protein
LKNGEELQRSQAEQFVEGTDTNGVCLIAACQVTAGQKIIRNKLGLI